jgi:hypothetical protein
MKNATGRKFDRISTEQERHYRFANDEVVTITRPLTLHVSTSGGHMIFDSQGVSHYVPPGWIHLWWVTREGKAHFVK